MPSANKKVPESVKMKDVAEHAEVSLMTISRALNTPEKVSPLTLKKIKKAIAELEYVPDLTAGTLSSKKSGFIAALVPFLNSSPLTDTIRALDAHLREHRYQLLLGSTNYSIQQEEALLIELLGRRPEAIVLTGSLHTSTSKRLLKRSGIPVVEIWDLPSAPIDLAVGYSNHDSGYQITQNLIDKGYQSIAYGITSSIDDRGEQRLQGYLSAVKDSGLPDFVERLGDPPVQMEHGIRAISNLLARDRKPEALICVSDTMAAGAIFECQRRKIRIPQEMAIAGFGDFEMARHLVPALTTVRVSGQEIGAKTAELILKRLQNRHVENLIVTVGSIFIERETT